MESLAGSSTTFLNRLVNTFSGFTYTVHGILLLISAVLLFLLSILYKNIRKKFPVKVNCWFCNNNTTVPYDLSNSWDCPQCNQYNGFKEDGSYNKVIKEQFNAKLNEDIFNTLKPSFSSSKNNLSSNGFCKLCNINQQLKIQQLALFVPLDENRYYEEIEQYKEKLEKAYKLCSKCEKTLQETLEKQKYNLLQDRLNLHKQSNLSQTSKNFITLNGKKILFSLKRNGILGLRWICAAVALLLFLALLVQYETEHKFIPSTLPELAIFKSLQTFSKVGKVYMREIYKLGKELSFAGFVCCLLTLFERQVKKNHITLLTWGLLHILLWSTLTGFQVVMSAVSLFLNSQAIHYKSICLNKKSLPKKSGFQPVKQVFSNFNFSKEENPGVWLKRSPVSKPLLGEDLSFTGDSPSKEDMKTPETNRKSTEGVRKRVKKKENESEITEDEQTENADSKSAESSPGLKGAAPSSSSVFSKAFLSTMEEERKGETGGSFGEVFDDLNGLRLGEKSKKSKPSNFLFTNHNFAEGKSSSSIIKPAKFIKNLSSSWTFTESNDCGSRSSTPSSGYSSQKAEKMEANRYDFGKTMTPISINPFGRHSPQECFDYYGGGGGFCNNFGYCSPGFVPFQQMQSPMGHTTIYTCTRPTNLPFPFQWQGFPNQKYSPSARFSDVSDCDNLFQNASKSFQKKQKWFRLKTFSYYLSIFLNFLTLVGLVYFISTGIILVDWKLPKLNFYL